jgi:ATP-dependent DNA helicase RecQ
LYQEGKNVVEIAAIRGLKEDTIYGHLQKIHERGDSIDLYNFISEEEVKTILEVIAKTPNDEGFLKPIFEALEEKVPYWKIRYAQYLG